MSDLHLLGSALALMSAINLACVWMVIRVLRRHRVQITTLQAATATLDAQAAVAETSLHAHILSVMSNPRSRNTRR
jgi:hypothetical protein